MKEIERKRIKEELNDLVAKRFAKVMTEKIEKELNRLYPLTFADSETGLMYRGKQEETCIRPLEPKESAIVEHILEVVNSLTKDAKENN